MKGLSEAQKAARAAHITLTLCCIALVGMHYVYMICREYRRWYCYAPEELSLLSLACLLVLSFFVWRSSRILAIAGFFVSLSGLVVVLLPVL